MFDYWHGLTYPEPAMLNFSFSEILIFGIIALVFIGPKELPEIARTLGRILNELKRATGDLSQQLLHPKEDLERQLRDTMEQLAKLEARQAEQHPVAPIQPESEPHAEPGADASPAAAPNEKKS